LPLLRDRAFASESVRRCLRNPVVTFGRVVDFRCSTGGVQTVAQVRIVAIKVGNLTSS
jgi:hypothetical protein